jgi:hypothetical protein
MRNSPASTRTDQCPGTLYGDLDLHRRGGHLHRQSLQGLLQRTSLQFRTAQIEHGAARLIEVFPRQFQGLPRQAARAFRRLGRRFQHRVQRLQPHQHSGQALSERIVYLAGQAVALLHRAGTEAALVQPASLHGDAQHVAHGVQQSQVFIGQLLVLGAGHIHQPQFPAPPQQGHAGVIAQPAGSLLVERRQSRAGDDRNALRLLQRPLAVFV